MPSRPSKLPRRISHSTPPSRTYARDHDSHDDDHDSSRGWRRGSADDHHYRPHRRRSVDSEDEAHHEPRDRRSHRSRRRGRSVDSDDDTYHGSKDKRSHGSQRRRRDRSIDSDDSSYRDEARHHRSNRSRRRERSIDSQDKHHHSDHQDHQASKRERHRSVRHPLRGSHRSPSRSSSASSSSSDSGFDRARDPSPKQPGRLRRIARSVSRLGHRRKPSVLSRSSSPSRSPSRSRKGRGDSHFRSRSHPPHSSSKHHEPHSPVDIIYTAARTAFEAGAMAALKLRNDPSPLMGAKGGKIVAAAVGAAVVDTFIDQRHPKRKGGLRHTVMRQATQMAIGNLVMPAVQHADKRHGKGVPVSTSVRGKGAWYGKMKGAGVKGGGGVKVR